MKRKRFSHASSITLVLVFAMLACGEPARGQTHGRAGPAPPATGLEGATRMVESRQLPQAIVALRALLLADPTNRRARELLAFALESSGDLEAERRERATLAADYPDDARVQLDYGRVLERSGDPAAALRYYRRAHDLSSGAPDPVLDAAIERTRGLTAPEIGVPVQMISDPDASSARVQAGAAIPFGSRDHVAILATRYSARARSSPASSISNALCASLATSSTGSSWAFGPRLDWMEAPDSGGQDLAAGGLVEGQTRFGSSLSAGARAEAAAPWDESAVTILHGGRTNLAEAHLYARWPWPRLLFQAGARRRELSIRSSNAAGSDRPEAWQSLWLGGADLALWQSGKALRGEMLDESMLAPTSLSSSMTLAYRHYDVTSQVSPEFDSIIGIAPRAQVDEGSFRTTWAAPGGSMAVDMHGGLSFDSARRARGWRAGGSLIWAPIAPTRLAMGYDEADELVTGLLGRRREGWVSIHVDL